MSEILRIRGGRPLNGDVCFAYSVALMIYQFGSLFTGHANAIGLIAALAVLGAMVYMLFFKKYSEATKLTRRV